MPGCPNNEGSLVRSLLVAYPAAMGTLRLDVASPEAAYRQRLHEAFYGALTRRPPQLPTPDVPASTGLGTTTLTAHGGGSIPRLSG